MKGYTRLPKKHLYLILGAAGILIFLLSLEVMMKVKDVSMYRNWLREYDVHNMMRTMTDSESFDVYLTVNLSLYFQKIIIPIGLSIHTYFSYIKLRLNKLFVFIWTVLLFGSAAYTLIGFDYRTIFPYGYIILYSIVIFTVLSLLTVIENSENF